ncbi:hypothetical protein C8R46DRAFT_1350718 [Mycena filopes]|nr:hypothetical protein C8R46DRAFT_1350718 [Mycena filopes]
MYSTRTSHHEAYRLRAKLQCSRTVPPSSRALTLFEAMANEQARGLSVGACSEVLPVRPKITTRSCQSTDYGLPGNPSSVDRKFAIGRLGPCWTRATLHLWQEVWRQLQTRVRGETSNPGIEDAKSRRHLPERLLTREERRALSYFPSSFLPSPSPALMLPTAQPLLAAHFVGVVLATIFYGITLAQAFAYYRVYTTDPRHMKLIVRTRLFRDRFLVLISAVLRKVALLLLLDTSQVFLTLASIYDYTIRLRGDETALQYVSKPFIASMAITSVVAFTVQMIYAYRVWRCKFPSRSSSFALTWRAVSAGNAYLTTSILALAFVALGSGTAMTAKTIRNPRWDETRVSDLPAGLILASTVTCDLLIAGAQVWLFHRHRLGRGRFAFTSRRRVAPPPPPPPSPIPTLPAVPEEAVRSSSSRRGSVLAGIAGLAGAWRMGPGSSVTAGEAGKEGGCDEDHDGCRLGALLTTLTLLVVNVGLLTSLDATLFLLLFLICPSNGTFLVPYILLSNCYVNSFLSILNSRRILRDLVENPEHFPVSFDFALDTG